MGPCEPLQREARAETAPGGDLPHPESAAGVLCPPKASASRPTSHRGQAARIALPTGQGVPPRCLHSPPTGNWDAGSAPSCPPAAPESRCSWLRQPSHQRQLLHHEAGGRELFFQRPAGRSGLPAREMPTAGKGRGKESSVGTGLDPLLAHLQSFSSSLKPRPPRRRTRGEWEQTHPAAAPERNLQGPPIPSKAASSKSKGNQAGKASPQNPSGKPSQPPRRARPSHPTGPEEQKSSGEGWKWEQGQPPWLLPVPNHSLARGEWGQSRMCQSRWLLVQTPPWPKRHQPSRATARSEQGMQRWHCHGEPLRPAKVSAASITCRGVPGDDDDTSLTGALTQGWRSQILPPQTAPARSTSIAAHRAAPRHARGRGRKSPSASPGMPGGRIPPLTPTPAAVTSRLSSPTP